MFRLMVGSYASDARINRFEPVTLFLNLPAHCRCLTPIRSVCRTSYIRINQQQRSYPFLEFVYIYIYMCVCVCVCVYVFHSVTTRPPPGKHALLSANDFSHAFNIFIRLTRRIRPLFTRHAFVAHLCRYYISFVKKFK